MSDVNPYTQEFLRGLRSVPDYVESLCRSCKGLCQAKMDDQCLVSAWDGYIKAAFDVRLNAFEVGRRCALSQVAQDELHTELTLPGGCCEPVTLPCHRLEA